jgi:hypothetical protein
MVSSDIHSAARNVPVAFHLRELHLPQCFETEQKKQQGSAFSYIGLEHAENALALWMIALHKAEVKPQMLRTSHSHFIQELSS